MNFLDLLTEQHKNLMPIKQHIFAAYEVLEICYANSGKALVCGNGGSASDSEHIVGELMNGFMLNRPIPQNHRDAIKGLFPDDAEFFARSLQGCLPAISLVSQTSLITAYANDVDYSMAFAQQVYGYGKRGDVLIAISTSGNSLNIINAVKVAAVFGIKTIGLTGEAECKMNTLCDVTINAPFNETFKIQECHIAIYHALCAMLEQRFFA